jgi:hypothetical protein
VRKYPLGEETLWDDREAVGAESLGVERIQAALKHDSKASSSFDEGAAGIIASQLEACLITTALTLVQACFKETALNCKAGYVTAFVSVTAYRPSTTLEGRGRRFAARRRN